VGRRSRSGLTRRGPSREPLLVLWVYCEGKTEVRWLDYLQRRFRDLAIHIEREGEVGAPTTIVERAAEKARELRRKRRNPTEGRDEVWVVFDRDEHPDVAGPMGQACGLGIGVAFSNPCFELWPLLHCADQAAWIHRHDCQRKLHGLHPKYHHDDHPYVDWPTIELGSPAAVHRSIELHRRGADAGDILRNPSATAWLLHERIAAGSDPDEALLIRFRAIRLESEHQRSLVIRLAEPVRGRILSGLGLG
jgi:hypothetical protein